MWPRISSFFRNLLRRDDVYRELDDELRASLEILTQEKVREGLSPHEARRQASLELGGVQPLKERVLEVRRGVLIDQLHQDVRFGFRTLGKNIGFTSVAVLTLALGIGALATTGLAIGLVMAAGFTQLLKSQLPALGETTAIDPITYVGVPAVLLAVAMFASFVPARRAMRVDPIVALRYE